MPSRAMSRPPRAMSTSTASASTIARPTPAPPSAAAENLADRLRELRDDHGQSILLIEHNVPLVLDLCDHVFVLNAGRLLADGPPATLGDNPEVLEAYLGGVIA